MSRYQVSYRATIVLLNLFLVLQVSGQSQFSQWAFGTQAGMDLSSSPATAINGTALDQVEGVATVSDANGILLFYTDGSTIWDMNDQPMPNGTGLIGSFTSTQATAIVQDPAACSRYYVFHNGLSPNNHLYWTMVDMDLNNGMGDVVIGQKNNLLTSNIDEKLTVVRHTTDLAYWVLIHKNNTNTFLAFLVTAGGIQAPVSSSSGVVYPPWAFAGQLKASPDGTKLVSPNNQCMLDLFDFDASTGVVSNNVPVHESIANWDVSSQAWLGGRSNYGAEFSPNGQVLYVSGDGFLYQYDLNAGTALDIANSEYLVYGSYQANMEVFGLQRGPNDKVYVAQDGRNTVAVINDPNVLGNGCNFQLNGVPLGNGIVRTTFPGEVGFFDNYVQNVDLGPDQFLCAGDSIELSITNVGDVLWSTGGTASTIQVHQPGTYWVEVSTPCGYGTDTIVIAPFEPPTVEIMAAATLCSGETISAIASDGSSNVLWNTGEATSVIAPQINGLYYVDLIHDCGVSSDTTEVYIMPFPEPQLEIGYRVCEDPIVITLSDPIIAHAQWSDGSNGMEVELLDVGNYGVFITDTAGCSSEFYFALIEDCPDQLFVPNAFSPDGDGMNDHFLPVTNHPENISYAIYDRWGKSVFQAGNGSIPWDGTINGSAVPVGVYVWVVDRRQSEDAIAHRLTGSVTVVR